MKLYFDGETTFTKENTGLDYNETFPFKATECVPICFFAVSLPIIYPLCHLVVIAMSATI